MKKFFKRRPVNRHEKGSGAITLTVIALFLACNLFLVPLGSAFRLFTSVVDKQFYTLNGSTDAYFDAINPEKKPVDFYFCMSEESLNENYTYGRILDTVRQFSLRYDFISLSFLDVYYDYDFIKKDLGVEESVTSDSVILYSAGIGYVVRSLSTFYIYDTEDTSNDDMIFNGEEIMATLVYRVLHKNFPKVYFTVGHGETSTQSMQNLFFSAGYDVWTADLSKNEIEEECSTIVISNPLYDFEEFKDGSSSEISRLDEFLARGGTLIVLRSPLAGELPRLDALCEKYGLSVKVGALLRDSEHSISSNAAALLLRYSDSDAAKAISLRTSLAGDLGDIAAKNVTSLTLADKNGCRVSPLIESYDSAALYRDGKRLSEGVHTVAAQSTVNGKDGKTGTLILIGTTGLGEAALLDLGSYGNEAFLYALLERTEGISVTPIGCGVVVLNTYPLTNLSGKDANTYFLALTLGVPAVLGVLGLLLIRRRRNR